MRINTAWKKIVFFIFLGVLLAGCDFTYHGDKEEESGEDGNSSGGGSSSGTPALVEGEWTDGTISKDGQIDRYTISVSKGMRYFVYLNDKSNGDGSKTAYIIGMKLYNGNTPISSSYTYDCWEKPFTFIALEDGTVTITAASNKYGNDWNWEEGTGTYGIRYTTRLEYKVLSEEDKWEFDNIITDGQTNKYSLSVTEGTKYSIFLNDKTYGDGSKTAYRIGITIIYTQDSNSDNPVICKDYDNACKLYSKPYTFTAPSTGTVTITAASNKSGNSWDWERGIGTYAIKYTSGS